MTEAIARSWRRRFGRGRTFGRRRFAVLLASLVALLLLAPALGHDPRAEADMALLFSLVVLGFASAARRTALAAALAVLWLVLTWARPFGDSALNEVLADATLIAICATTIEAALRRALTARVVDEEMLCAAVSAYVLLGVAWAAAYTILETLQPGSFALSETDATHPWNALLYFSFVTLTTLGYGDILPVTPVARAWAMVEAAAGSIYLAILIARLVSSYRPRVERDAADRSDAASGETA